MKQETYWKQHYAIHLLSARSIKRRICEEIYAGHNRQQAIKQAVAWLRRHKGGGFQIRSVLSWKIISQKGRYYK